MQTVWMLSRQVLQHNLLVPNHQLRGQIQSWLEAKDEAAAITKGEEIVDDVVPAVNSRANVCSVRRISFMISLPVLIQHE